MLQPINRTLFNWYHGRTLAARVSHPEPRKLTPEEEKAVVKWMEKRDTLGFPPGYKGLVIMVVSLLNSIDAIAQETTTPPAPQDATRRYQLRLHELWAVIECLL